MAARVLHVSWFHALFNTAVALLYVLQSCLLRLCSSRKQKRAAVAATDHRVFADDVTGMNAAAVRSIVYPLDVEDVREAVLRAGREGASIAARGQAHTMGGQTVPAGGYVLDMRFLNRVTAIDPTARTVTCQPGATWSDLIQALDPLGLSPRTMQSYSSFSVGGSLSVNAHGITNDFAFHECVLALRLIDAAGEELTVTRGDPLFGHVVGGFGLFGVVVSVTLRVDANCGLELENIETDARAFPALYARALADARIAVKLCRINILNPDQIFMYLFRAAPGSECAVSHIGDHAREMGPASRLIYKWLSPTSGFQALRYALEALLRRPLDWTGSATRNSLMFESASPLQQLYCPVLNLDRCVRLKRCNIACSARICWCGWVEFGMRGFSCRVAAAVAVHRCGVVAFAHHRHSPVWVPCSVSLHPPGCSTHILQEFFIPNSPDGGAWSHWHAHLRAVLADHIANDSLVRLLNITIRCVQRDEVTRLPYAAHPHGVLAFVLYYRTPRTMAADAQLERLHTRLAAKAVELGGTFYLPYRHHYTAGALTAAYPSARAFFAAKLRADPHERFSNAWYAAYAPQVLSDAERAAARAEGLALRCQQQEAAQCSAGVLAIADAAQEAPAARAGAGAATGTWPTPTAPAAAASVEALALDVRVQRQHSYSAVMADAALRSSLLRFFANVFTVEPAAAMMAHVEAAFAAAAAEAEEDACTHPRDATHELAAAAGAGSAGAGAAAMPTPTSSYRSEAARTVRHRHAAAGSAAGPGAGAEAPAGSIAAGSNGSSDGPLPTDVAVFRQLAARLSAFRGLLSTARRLQRTLAQTAATRRQITGEAARVLSQLGLSDGGVDGWAAIGDAGRYVTALREAAGIGGRQFVVHDGIGLAGVLERGSVTPVGEFVPINYATARMGAGALVHPPAAGVNGAHNLTPSRATAVPPATSAAPVPPASVDLVTMFQGLHHLPPHTLPHFLASVHAMLRPGGVFIIREHNAEGAGVAAIADLAHSTFNAVTGASEAEEAAEVRAFRPLKAWRALLEAAGFVDARVYECQADDPTVDIMMAFVKVEGPAVAASVAAAAAAGAPSAVLRRAASESGASADASTRGLVRQAGAAAASAGARGSAAPAPDRHAPSSAAVAQVRALLAASGAGPRDRLPAATWHTLTEWLLVDVPTRYGAFLEHTPWFDYPYLAVVGLFWRLFAREAAIAWRKHGFLSGLWNEYTVMNVVIGGVLTAVFVQLAVLAIYPRWATPPESVDTHVQLLVAAQPRVGTAVPTTGSKPPIAPAAVDAGERSDAVGSAVGCVDAAWTASGLPDLLSIINNPAAAVLVPWQSSPSESLRLPSRTLLPALDDPRCYAALSVPRYKPFGAAVKALARAGVQVVQVAGHSLMQVRVVVESDAQVALLRGLGSDAEFLFEFTDPATPTHREVALAVHVPALCALLLQLEAAGIPLSRRGASVDQVHLHDF